MTTINSTILKHHRKTDGTYNVKICLRHKGNNAFINTKHFVDESSLTKDLKILNKTLNTSVERTVAGYRKAIEKLGMRTKFLEIKELKKYLIDIDRHVDFIDFCRLHINDLKQKNKPRSASNYTTIVNSLIDFFGTEVVAIEEFNLRCLIDYERFLRSERILVRKNQFGKDVKTRSQGLFLVT